MSLTRATMSPDEATALAAVIDKTHLPFRVKRVATQPGGKAVVEVEDEQTGYVLPIISPEHWRLFSSQSGNASALDTFGETGTRVLSYLDTVIVKLEKQRDDLLSQAEQFDERVRQMIGQKTDIEKAVAAVDAIGTFAPQLKRPASTGPQVTMSAEHPEGTPDFVGDPPAIRARQKQEAVFEQITAEQLQQPLPVRRFSATKRKRRQPTPIGRLPGNMRRTTPKGETQKEWTLRELQRRGRARVLDLATDLSPLLNVPVENLIKTISSMFSYEMKRTDFVVRTEMGWYEWRGPRPPAGPLTPSQPAATTPPPDTDAEPAPSGDWTPSAWEAERKPFAFDPADDAERETPTDAG